MPEVDTVFFETPEAFERWLEVNGDRTDEVWITIAKKATGIACLDMDQAIEVALCFG